MDSRSMDVKQLEHRIFELGHTGISHQLISRWLNGQNSPSLKYISSLSDIFDVPMESFTQV